MNPRFYLALQKAIQKAVETLQEDQWRKEDLPEIADVLTDTIRFTDGSAGMLRVRFSRGER